MTALERNLAYYKSQHTTLGCKVSHLIGIPLIALALPTVLFSRKTAAQLFSVGWACQFIGHYFFEKNQPVLLSESRDPLTILSAVIFCVDGWRRVLSGRSLTDAVDYQNRHEGNGGGNGRSTSRETDAVVARVVSSSNQ